MESRPFMKFSLRSLMIVVTLLCVVIGGRMEYLRRMADFHERESLRFGEKLKAEFARYKTENGGNLVDAPVLPGRLEARANYYHAEMARAFRQAIYRPW